MNFNLNFIMKLMHHNYGPDDYFINFLKHSSHLVNGYYIISLDFFVEI